jgi:RimJ/RimL family protein N-acetyltransferase
MTTPFPPVINLRGHGLHLREWTDGDVPTMVTLFDETEVDRWTPLRSPFDHTAARAYLDQARARRADNRAIQLAITTDGHEARGEILLFRTSPEGRDHPGPDAELAYAIGAAHRRQGLAARAVRLITDHAYRDLGIRHVLLRIDPGNTASVAVARTTGFQLTDLPGGAGSSGGPLRTWRHEGGRRV